MIPFGTLRLFFKISWVKKNQKAIYYLNDMFYLLIALRREGRNYDFVLLQKIYFDLISSIILHSQGDAEVTLDELMQIPWFKERTTSLSRSYIAFKNGLECLSKSTNLVPVETQVEFQRHFSLYVKSMKSLIDFDEKDEARINSLLENPDVIDEATESLFRLFE